MLIDLNIPAEATIKAGGNGVLYVGNKLEIADYPANIGIWLRENATRYPTKSFLKERGGGGKWQSVSYSEMLAKTNQISNGLLALGLEPAAPIAVLSNNSINMALVQFAAMQIGHPVVPISFAYSVRSQTGSLIKHILDVTNAPVLVMSDANLHMPKLNRWDNSGRTLYAFSGSENYEEVFDFGSLISGETELSTEGEARFRAVTADTIAKIQFTSGSTNLPKGVEVTHGMQTSNQAVIYQLWPFLDHDDVYCDWLPWNHTFGGNFVTNMALMHGATMYIDNGNPTPAGLENTVKNIIDVQPTVYFGVPASYAALYGRMQQDDALREAFFGRLKFIFVAAAALDQKTYEGMLAMGKETTGHAIPFFSAWGTTETAPGATLVYWLADDIRVIGLPVPGTTLKLIPNEANRYEVRVTGPNITQGYFANTEATEAAFDEENFYRTGDAVAFYDPDNPSAGIIFDGRIGEDFKLTSGVWVRNAQLRASINGLGKPYLMEIVIAAPNRPYICGLVIPNVAALRARFADDAAADDATFLHSDAVVNLFRHVFRQHNEGETGSSKRFKKFAILTTPPQFDTGETTDKGYINQRAVLRNHAALVEQLYTDEDVVHIWEV